MNPNSYFCGSNMNQALENSVLSRRERSLQA